VSLCLVTHHSMETYGGRGGTAQVTLKLGAR